MAWGGSPHPVAHLLEHSSHVRLRRRSVIRSCSPSFMASFSSCLKRDTYKEHPQLKMAKPPITARACPMLSFVICTGGELSPAPHAPQQIGLPGVILLLFKARGSAVWSTC